MTGELTAAVDRHTLASLLVLQRQSLEAWGNSSRGARLHFQFSEMPYLIFGPPIPCSLATKNYLRSEAEEDFS